MNDLHADLVELIAEMRRGGGTETGWISIDTARKWAKILESHRDELLGVVEDAARYRAIVGSGAYAPGRYPTCPIGLRSGGQPCSKSELDAAIDAARHGRGE